MERKRRLLEQLAYTPEEEIQKHINHVLEENKMIEDGVIDDSVEEYFEGKRIRRSMQKRRNRLLAKKAREATG